MISSSRLSRTMSGEKIRRTGGSSRPTSKAPPAFKAFRECRAKFASICRESHSIEEAQVTADAELLPLVRQLEGDLESLKAKTRIAGGGAAIVTVVGAIATSLLDTALIPATLLSGGSLMSFIHRYANKKAEEKKLRSRAALFLWEARNKADKSNS